MEYAKVEAQDATPATAHNRRANPITNMDGWDMYDL